jgi:hypothetical protein
MPVCKVCVECQGLSPGTKVGFVSSAFAKYRSSSIHVTPPRLQGIYFETMHDVPYGISTFCNMGTGFVSLPILGWVISK